MKSQNQETSSQTPGSPQQSHLSLILETPEEEKFVNSCDSLSSSNRMAYNNVSSPSSSTLIGEYIGIESCLDLENNEDIFASSSKKEESTNHGSCSREKRNQRWVKKKEFPPPIPLLARTENLPSHMPWVLKRYYTGDGRLILREEKVRHHEYFRAHRCNGRLTLHLVPLDDEVWPPPFLVNHERRHDFENDHECNVIEEDDQVLVREHEEGVESTEMDLNGNEGVENERLVEESTEMDVNGNEGVENESLVEESTEMDVNGNDGVENESLVEESKEMDVNGNDGVENESLVEESREMDVNGNDGVENDRCVKNVDCYETLEEEEEEEEVVHDDKRVPSVESSGSAGKCLNYSSVRTSSTCIFGMPVPAVRPVHS